ncbi:MAG: hypothetical protein H6819_03460 [Phycisphaerales bacterium]|nr:hypothetical protein [Phycisphaerales bacterium]MCB9856254.1 hypothetical protein [Phycisphaerales bacterium]MCB9863307.1 hypothetical protein [Phycisphaerales bacterium]
MAKDGKTLNLRIQPHHIMLRRRPKGMPKAYFDRIIGGGSRGGLLIWLSISLLFLAYAYAIFGLLYMYRAAAVPQYWVLVFIGLLVSSSLVLDVGKRRIASAFATELAASHGFVCLECGYSLVGSEDGGTCSECNAPINLGLIRTTWYEYFPATLDRCTAEARGDAG